MDASGQDSKGVADLSAAAKRSLRAGAAQAGVAGRACGDWLGRLLRDRRAIEVLTVLALVGGVLMIASEFLDLFHVDSARGGQIPDAARTSGENHGYALLIIGVAVIAATFVARSTEQWLPALAATALGAIALMIAAFGDLPDAGRSELVRAGKLGSATPAVGLWVELIGAAMVTAASAGIAYVLRASGSAPKDYQR